jgi:hypothetical protein
MHKIERTLDLSEGTQNTSEVTFNVSETESREGIKYSVKVNRDLFLSSVVDTEKLKEFWEGVEKKVLEDVEKNEKNNI